MYIIENIQFFCYLVKLKILRFLYPKYYKYEDMRMRGNKFFDDGTLKVEDLEEDEKIVIAGPDSEPWDSIGVSALKFQGNKKNWKKKE